MNTIRSFFLAIIVMIFSATFTLAGEIQGPGKSDPTSNPTPTTLTNTSTSDGLRQPTSTEEMQIEWQNATTMLVEILLTIF
jgi:hypothetical protein